MSHQHARPSMHQTGPDPILVAVPGRDDKQIEVWQLPDEALKIIVPRVQTVETGTCARASSALTAKRR